MPSSIRLSWETEARLKALAERTGRSKAYHLRELVEQGLDDLEDYYLAAEVMERIHPGEEEVLTSEEFSHRLDDGTAAKG